MSPKRNRIETVRADSLRVHPSAQRKLVPIQIKRLMAGFDLDAIGTLHVVDIDGQLWIIDGQHRWTAIMRHGLGEWRVRCEVHVNAETHAEASALFLKLNQRATVASYDKFVNEVQAGEPIAVEAKNIVEKHGLKIDRQARDGHVLCVASLKKVHEIDGGHTLDRTIGLLNRAYGTASAAYEGKLVEGVASIAAKYNGELDEDALIKKLAKYPGGASALVGDARGLKKIRRTSVAACIAEVIVEAYNSGRRSGRIAA